MGHGRGSAGCGFVARRARAWLAGAAAWAALGGAAAAPLPAPEDEAYVVVKAGTVITVSGEEIRNGEIVIVDGKVSLVGVNLDYPKNARVIDARRETVMPGLVLARSRAGLPGYRRTGVHGDWGVGHEVSWESLDLEPLLRHGFTAVAWYPDGEGIPGVAGAYRVGGPEEQRLLSSQAYLRVTFTNAARDKKALREALEKAKAENEKVKKAREEWEKARKEFEEKQKAEGAKPGEPKPEEKKEEPKPEPPKADQPPRPEPPKEGDKPAGGDPKAQGPGEFKPPATDPGLRPLMDHLEKRPAPALLVEVGKSSDLLHLWEVLKPYEGLAHALFVAPATGDLRYAMEEWSKRKPRVLLSANMSTLPQTTTVYNAAAELAGAGCEVSLAPAGDSSWGFERYLASAADLVRNGLPRKEALKALTLHPARLLGIESRIGTIEKDRDADLVFLDGDPLVPGSRVMRVMILGEVVWDRDEEGPR